MGYSAIAPQNGRPELNSDPQNTLIFSIRGIAAGTIIAPRGGYPRPKLEGMTTLKGKLHRGLGSNSTCEENTMKHSHGLPSWLLTVPVVMVAVAAFGQGSLEKVAVSLHNGWFVHSSAGVTATGAQISTPGFSTAGWMTTSIPATPLGAQLDAGLYPSPYVGTNAQQIPGWPAAGQNFANVAWPNGSPYSVHWWFLNQFTLPSTLAGQRIYVHFDGINYRANLWVNGQQVATNTQLVGTYTQFEFDITSVARIGSANSVALDIAGPLSSDLGIVFVDWYPLPADRNEGVWRDAWITNSGPVKVRYPQVQTSVSANLASAALTVTAELSNPTTSSVTGTLSGTVNPGGITFSQPVTLAAGAANQVFTFPPASYPQLNITNPALWWPAKLGPQNLYQASIQFAVGTTVSDTNAFNFGIRKLDTGLGPVTAAGQQWRWFKINNQPIMLKGAGWAPDMMVKRDPARINAMIQLITDMGMNMIRFEGKMEDQTFYDLADKNGIMLMAGWTCCSQWEQWKSWSAENQAVANSSLDTQMRALRNHPSAFLWMNSSDLIPPASVEQQEVNIERADNWPNPVVAMANYGTSSVTGLNGMKEGGPYEWEPPIYFYADTSQGGAFGFIDEASVGPNVPAMESMLTGLNTNPVHWPIDTTWTYHMGGTPFDNLNVVTSAINGRFGTATSAADYVKKSQAQNYESWRAQFESYETNKTKTDGTASTGFVTWMLTSGWFSLHWQVFDWYLRPSAAYFGVKKSGEPLHIAWDYGFRNNVTVTNDFYQTSTGLVATADVLNFDMTNKYHNSVTLTAGPASSNVAFAIPALTGLTTTYFVKLKLQDSTGKVLSDNFYWYSTRPDALGGHCKWYFCPTRTYANLSALQTLPLVTVAHSDSFGATSTTTTLTNSGATLAFLIRARVTSNGNEVLPVFWTDNYISLLPGETRTLTATFPSGTVPAGSIVQLDGFNVNPN
jgi:exo-1,4-beta-D-glucosaminidase